MRNHILQNTDDENKDELKIKKITESQIHIKYIQYYKYKFVCMCAYE